MADHPRWDSYEMEAVAAFLAESPLGPDARYEAILQSQRFLEAVSNPDEHLTPLLPLFDSVLPEWTWLGGGQPVVDAETLASTARNWESRCATDGHRDTAQLIWERCAETGAWLPDEAALIWLLRSRRATPEDE